LLCGIELAETSERKGHVVVSTIRGRSQVDDGAEVWQAGFDIAFDQEVSPLFKGARGLAGHGEFLNGDDGIVARGGRVRGRLRVARER